MCYILEITQPWFLKLQPETNSELLIKPAMPFPSPLLRRLLGDQTSQETNSGSQRKAGRLRNSLPSPATSSRLTSPVCRGGNCHLFPLLQPSPGNSPPADVRPSSCSAFVLGSRLPSRRCPLARGTLWLMHTLPAPACRPACGGSPGGARAVAAVTAPLTAFPSSARPAARSWAWWPGRLPPAPWDSGRVRSLLICDNNPSSKM